MRLPTLLLVLALPASLLAGCTAPDAPDAAPPPSGGAGNGRAPPPPAGQAPPPHHDAQPVEDAGDIAGPFRKSWNIEVASVAFREAHVDFALTGVQPDAPPTARVDLRLLAPDGSVVRSETVGAGGKGDRVAWVLRAADLPAPGTYVLEAATVTPAGAAPTLGLAKYQLHAQVLY